MRFVSPKVDFTFKKIFGSEQSERILISFLNAIVYGGEKTIESLKIINPYNPGKIETFKETYLDVKATLADGSIVVIEMQIGRMSAFSKRIIYNLSKAYANQLGVAENYLLLRPAIAVTIVDFVLFKDYKKVISKFIFQEEEEEELNYPDAELQLFFVELPKFKKTLADLESLSDKWIYFLKEAAKLDEIPAILGEVEEIEHALSIANQSSMTEEELEAADRRSITLQDEKGRITYAKEEGERKGRFEATLSMVMVLVNQRFGEIPKEIASQIEDLDLYELENLVKVFLNFTSLEELENWLEERKAS